MLSEDLMRMYEGMFLVDAGDGTADWEGVLAAVNTVLSRAKAEIVSVCKWDERRLAYPIGNCKRGIYILGYFRADPAMITGIERDVVLSETLVRAMILRADRIPQEVIDADTPALCAQRAREASEARAAERAAEASAAESAAADAEAPAGAEAVADEWADTVEGEQAAAEPTPAPMAEAEKAELPDEDVASVAPDGDAASSDDDADRPAAE